MKILIIVCAALFFYSSPAHGYDKLAAFLYPEYNISLEQFPSLKLNEAKSILQIIEIPRLEGNQYTLCLKLAQDHIMENDISAAGYAASFKRFDFSGDGLDDLMFSSYCGGEELINLLWIRDKSGYVFASILAGSPLFQKNRSSEPLSLLTRSGWCCAGYVGAISLYSLKKIDGKQRYVLVKKTMEIGNVQIPGKRQAATNFMTTNDKYRLRASPEVLDEPDPDMSEFHGKPTFGNIIAEFEKDSKGEAIAMHTDKTGRVWWFVIMAKEAKTTYTLFYNDNGGYKTGWMSSRYLKIIE